jgi:hypothetical protein
MFGVLCGLVFLGWMRHTLTVPYGGLWDRLRAATTQQCCAVMVCLIGVPFCVALTAYVRSLARTCLLHSWSQAARCFCSCPVPHAVCAAVRLCCFESFAAYVQCVCRFFCRRWVFVVAGAQLISYWPSALHASTTTVVHLWQLLF